jgi:8-oxo-dGTP diphosphatase
MMKKIKVVAAVIFWNDLVLCVQRPKNKLLYISEKFEFPGGKIEEGETEEEALKRELLEELNLTVEIKSFFMTVEHEYPDFEITMHSFICEVDSGELILNEHIDKKWLKINELNSLDWVEKLISNG